MAAGAMAFSNPLLLNPLLLSTTSMMQQLSQNSNSADLNLESDLMKGLKSLLPQIPMMTSLWSMTQQQQFQKPTIADTFAGITKNTLTSDIIFA